MGKKFKVGDKVDAIDGLVGKVVGVDQARNIVAVESTGGESTAPKGMQRTYRPVELEKQ
jgi:preprotein translocase subunit YajC